MSLTAPAAWLTTRWRVRVVGVAAVALVAALACGLTAVAQAAPGHRYSRMFGTSSPGQLTSVGGVAVRGQSADVFVADPAANRVILYSTAGDFKRVIDTSLAVTSPTFLARDLTSGDVYVGGTNPLTGSGAAIARYSASGTLKYAVNVATAPGGLTSGIGGLALDSRNGRLYVTDPSTYSVDVFANSASASTYLRQFGGNGPDPNQFTNNPGPIAVDGTGDVYVGEYGRVAKFEGTQLGAASNPYVDDVGADVNVTGVAADATTNDVYIASAPDFVTTTVSRYSSTGDLISRFGRGDVQGFVGISVDQSTQNVFVTDFLAAGVKVFVPFVAPGVVTGASTNVTETSATVNGQVDPDGVETSYSFEYGVDTNYGTATPSTPVGSGSDPEDASANLDALQPNTTYHYRLVASNAEGRSAGDDQTFTTAAGAPTIADQSATSVTFDSATLGATVNPNGNQSTSYFQYGTTTDYGSDTPDTDTGAGSQPVALSARITGLAPGTTYHYRAVSSNGIGTPSVGPDQTFTTALAPPAATMASITGVARGTATLTGTANTRGLAGSYTFTISATNSPYSYTTPATSLQASNSAQTVSAPVSGLPDGGTFVVTLRVSTSTSTTISDQAGFSTPSGPPPIALRTPNPATNPYDCVSPRINTPRGSLRAGSKVVLTGTDLGYSGTVKFGSRRAVVTEYTPSAVTAIVPAQVEGSILARIECAKPSNDIRVRVLEPSNTYSAKLTPKRSAASLTAKLPGPGHLIAKGKYVATLDLRPRARGTVRATVRLNAAGRKRLAAARSRKLRVSIEIRYRPTGGSTRVARRTAIVRE